MQTLLPLSGSALLAGQSVLHSNFMTLMEKIREYAESNRPAIVRYPDSGGQRPGLDLDAPESRRYKRLDRRKRPVRLLNRISHLQDFFADFFAEAFDTLVDDFGRLAARSR